MGLMRCKEIGLSNIQDPSFREISNSKLQFAVNPRTFARTRVSTLPFNLFVRLGKMIVVCVNCHDGVCPAMKSLLFLGIVRVLAALSLQAQAPVTSTFSLSPGDVTEAIVVTSGYTRLKIVLTPNKSDALAAFTEMNLNRQVKILVGDRVRSEPFVRERILGPSMELYASSPEDALETVKDLFTSSKLSFEQLQTWTDESGAHYAEKRPPGAGAQLSAKKLIKDPGTNAMLKELQGSWVVVRSTTNGKESHDPALMGGDWNFQGDELILESPQKGKARFALEIDEQSKQKAFHLTSIEPASEGTGWMLFSRETNALKIAFYDNLEGRPESFEPQGEVSKPVLVVVVLTPGQGTKAKVGK
jgi:uncharacterized protein (TIGR03067 family)